MDGEAGAVLRDVLGVATGLPQHIGDLRCVGRVRHDHHAPRKPVGDEVVDDPGLVVQAQLVLGLPHLDRVDVAGERGLHRLLPLGAGEDQRPQVGHIEHPGVVAHRGVLRQHAPVVQRHRPAREVHELGAGRLVRRMQRRAPQLPCHGPGA